MGNGLRSSKLNDAEESIKCVNSVTISLRHEDFRHRQAICRQSWHEMSMRIHFEGDVAHCSSRLFSRNFFLELEALDKSHVVVPLFQPLASSSSPDHDRSAILFRIVAYVLRLSDQSEMTIYYLRKLGELHAAYKILQPELSMFRVAFLNTLATFDTRDSSVTAWTSLLEFVIGEMGNGTTAVSSGVPSLNPSTKMLVAPLDVHSEVTELPSSVPSEVTQR